jgi:hypothetical protein
MIGWVDWGGDRNRQIRRSIARPRSIHGGAETPPRISSSPPPHTHTQFRFTPPSAVISGCLGLALYDIMGACSKLLQVELESTLRSIEVNMCVTSSIRPSIDKHTVRSGTGGCHEHGSRDHP